MRKHHRRQILDILNAIKEAQKNEAYGDCQEAAFSVCDFIDGLVGKDSQTVSLLEQYCELLFKVNNGELNKKALSKHMTKIEDCFNYELKPHIEIVFLSYKASMSDCLESIYFAAKDCPDCDAYFMPIPYFERNTDKSLGEERYEGAEHYKNIPEIVDYKTYDFETRLPDAIITFNIYENINLLTQVHSDFFCKRLRAFTSMLVYVPYYLVVDNRNSIKETNITPGCVYAHKIIVQSEETRNSYIRIYRDLYGGTQDFFGKAEEKIIALGTPKLDKVVNSKRENFYLPQEWRELIGDKKVILFNLSLYQFFYEYDSVLGKLIYIIKTFNKWREKVILWWRPHPLFENTIKVAQPGLYKNYKTIVKAFKADGLGIFDETNDLHRAISYSDAYYGDDGSSVAGLYMATGKPIMFTDRKVLTDARKFNPTNLFYFDNDVYFTPEHFNRLFKMDKQDNLELEQIFKNEEDFTGKLNPLYGRPTENNGKLYFPPLMAKEFAIYSPKNKKMDKIPCNLEVSMAFSNAVAYKDSVFFIPFSSPSIAKLNIYTNEIINYENPAKQSKYCTNLFYFHQIEPVVIDSLIWFASQQSNEVISFDMETGVSKKYAIGDKEYKFSAICFDGENFWLAPYLLAGTPLIKWNPEKGILEKIKEIYKFGKEFCPDDSHLNSWFAPFYGNEHIWMISYYAKESIKINVKTNVTSIAEEFEYKTINPFAKKFDFATLVNNKLYAYREFDETLIEYCFETKQRREIIIKYNEKDIKELETIIKFSSKVNEDEKNILDTYRYFETSMFNLNDFIFCVSSDCYDEALSKKYIGSFVRNENLNTDGTAGKAIYDFIKGNLLE